MLPSLCLLLYLTASSLVSVQGGGLKILGGYVQEYSIDSKIYYWDTFAWGKSKADNYSKDIEIEEFFCWSKLRKNHAYCRLHLIASTKDDPDEEHYQIIGSYQEIFYEDNAIVERKFQNGTTDVHPPYEKYLIATGKYDGDHFDCAALEALSSVPMQCFVGHLYFFVNKTTQPSITDDISSVVWDSDDVYHTEEEFVNFHEENSVRVQVNEFRVHTLAFKGTSKIRLYFWRAPTVLVGAKILAKQANLISFQTNPKMSLVLSNAGSGTTSSNLPLLGTTQKITTTSELRFLTNWDFTITIEQKISFEIFSATSETELSSSFSYSNEEEMTRTNSVETSETITWPSECPHGIRILYEVIEVTEVQDLPVELSLKRAGVVWTEIDTMRVTLRKLSLKKFDCCLFVSASGYCGEEDLPICDKDNIVRRSGLPGFP